MERVQDGDLERENAVLGEAGIPRLDAEHRRRERSNKLMVRRGYPKDFSGLICNELKTDFLCERMMYYIAGDEMHSLEDVADEMLSLKAFRDRLVEIPGNTRLQICMIFTGPAFPAFARVPASTIRCRSVL